MTRQSQWCYCVDMLQDRLRHGARPGHHLLLCWPSHRGPGFAALANRRPVKYPCNWTSNRRCAHGPPSMSQADGQFSHFLCQGPSSFALLTTFMIYLVWPHQNVALTNTLSVEFESILAYPSWTGLGGDRQGLDPGCPFTDRRGAASRTRLTDGARKPR